MCVKVEPKQESVVATAQETLELKSTEQATEDKVTKAGSARVIKVENWFGVQLKSLRWT